MELPLYVSKVAQTIADIHGNTQDFKAGEPVFIPRPLVDIALTAGIERYTGATVTKTEPVPDPAATVDEVVAAIRKLMEAGDTKAFGTTGEPKLAALKKATAKDVDDATRDAAWELVKAEG